MMYKSLKEYVKKSNYFKELSDEERENKLVVLEQLLDQEEVDASLRDELIKNYYRTPILSERSDIIPSSYNLLDAVLKKEEWLIAPSQLMNAIKQCKREKGKNFRVDLYFKTNGRFQCCIPDYTSKYNSAKAVMKQLGSSM